MLLGELNGGLYTLSNTIQEVSTIPVANKTHSANVASPKSRLEDAKLWYIRLGHTHFPNMKYACPKIDVSNV